jgi:hypothetical protein
MSGAPVEAKIRLALDEHLTVLSAGCGVETLLGFSAEDFLTSKVSLKDRIHSDDGDIAGVLFSPNSKDRSGTFNIRLRHADGTIRCVKGQYSKEPANGGEGAVLELLLQDAKSLWKALAEPTSLTTIDPVMNSVEEALYFKNRNHVLTAANRKALLGWPGAGGDGDGLLGLTD